MAHGVEGVKPKLQAAGSRCMFAAIEVGSYYAIGRGRSVSTKWFADHVHNVARVVFTKPRLVFDGTPINPKTGKPDGYPKDLMLTLWGSWSAGYELWDWREPLERGVVAPVSYRQAELFAKSEVADV